MIAWGLWAREPQLITPADLQRRLRAELEAVSGSERRALLIVSIARYRRYRVWLEGAMADVEGVQDPNMIITDWSRIRPRPWMAGGRRWWWPRRPTDAVVVPARVLGDA